MKTKALTITTLILAAAFTSCTNPAKPTTNIEIKDTIIKDTIKPLNNLASIIEIPTTDLGRAIKFYEGILSLKIEEADMGGVKMGIIPNETGTINVVLANGPDYKPTSDGAVVYLNAGDNLQTILDKIETNGGKIIVPKTQISPEMGYFALFIDTEGNKLGLHSSN